LRVPSTRPLVLDDPPERALAARERAEDELLVTVMAQSLAAESGTEGFGFENILGVGLSERVLSGRPTGEEAVVVYVVRKAPPGEVEPSALVPTEYEGVPTDVVESGEFVAETERGRHRPALSGLSLGHSAGGIGTLGFIARREGELVVVSNNHVLARENEADPGDVILQPAATDGGTSADDEIARLEGFEPLDFYGPNTIDGAFARTSRELVGQDIYGIGRWMADPLEPHRDMLARKCGRTTGITRGIVFDANASIKMRYQRGIVLLQDQALVRGVGTPFSDRGDSGSLVLEESSGRPFGLLCGGSPRFSVVNRVQRVLDKLGVSFPA
jgi:hypothetical protein